MAYEYTTQGYTVNDSGRRLVVDPVTRIEGHLRCEVNINDDNVITNGRLMRDHVPGTGNHRQGS